MKMTWANADGFQVASKDNLMMLETDNFLGADGDASLGDFKQRESDAIKILRRAFDNADKKWDAFTSPYISQVDAARNSYKAAFPFNIKLTLDELKSIKRKFNDDLGIWESQKDQERGNVRAKTFGLGAFSALDPRLVLNKEEVEIFRRSSKARANIQALNQLSKELDNIIKLKEEQVKAEEEKKLAEEKKRLAMEEAKRAAETGSPVAPPTGSSGSDVLGALGGGKSNKTLLYVGIGVAVLIVGYFVTRRN
jgi:hypothetical protein